MQWTDLFPAWEHLALHTMTETADGVCISTAACTICQTVSMWGHGGFTRTVPSLPGVPPGSRLVPAAFGAAILPARERPFAKTGPPWEHALSVGPLT